MADAPGDLLLRPINGSPTAVSRWLTTFHLVLAVLDPFTAESAWLLPTVSRILRVYGDADCRVGLVTTSNASEARAFLGPYALEFLTFADPERETVKGLGLERLPALVHIRQDLSIAGAAEGWHPDEWREVTHRLSKAMSWSGPIIPGQRDPMAFDGSPALG